MRPGGSPHDLNHLLKQTDVYEDRGANRALIATESRPTRSIQGGMSQNEHKGRYGSFSEKTGDPQSFAQPQYNNWQARPSNVAQLASVSPGQTSASQFDASNASISASKILGEKRKRRIESGDEGVFPCRFCGKKFSKSQALGGHMNRHREERNLEQINKARDLLEQQDQQQGQYHPNFFQNQGPPFDNFIPRTPSSQLPPDIAAMQTYQQNNIYHASPVSWNERPFQNTPYASDVKPDEWIPFLPQNGPAYGSRANMPYVSSEGRNHGMSYEGNSAQQQLLPSETANTSRAWPSSRSVGVPTNYLQTQAGQSTSATAESFNPAFQTHSSYPLQSVMPGSDFSGQGLEAMVQFSSPSSVPVGMQFIMSPNSSMSVDSRNTCGTSVDGQSLPSHLGYLTPNSAPTMGFMQNEQDFGLALVADGSNNILGADSSSWI